MLSTYNTSVQPLTENEDLVFALNKAFQGCSTTHAENSSTIKLNSPGYYYVSFHGDAATSSSTSVDPIIVTLYNNGVAVPAAYASALSTDDGDIVNLSFSTIIKVGYSCPVVDNDAQLVFTNT